MNITIERIGAGAEQTDATAIQICYMGQIYGMYIQIITARLK